MTTPSRGCSDETGAAFVRDFLPAHHLKWTKADNQYSFKKQTRRNKSLTGKIGSALGCRPSFQVDSGHFFNEDKAGLSVLAPD